MKKLVIVCSFFAWYTLPAQLFNTIRGEINFTSTATLEIIKAKSNELQGILDVTKKIFAFKLNMKTFQGFNNPLQREHFFENYLEISEFPEATFKGKILETLKKGQNKYRAKGDLTIHGITKEVIIDVDMLISGENVTFESNFIIPLDEYKIELPMIVNHKIAKEVNVRATGVLTNKL